MGADQIGYLVVGPAKLDPEKVASVKETRVRTLSTGRDPHPTPVWSLPKSGGKRWEQAFDTEIEAVAYGLERAMQRQSDLHKLASSTKAAIKKANEALVEAVRKQLQVAGELEDVTDHARVLAERLAELGKKGGSP